MTIRWQLLVCASSVARTKSEHARQLYVKTYILRYIFLKLFFCQLVRSVYRDQIPTVVPSTRPRSSHVARIRPDQQVIQSKQQVLDEWCHVGPFLGLQGNSVPATRPSASGEAEATSSDEGACEVEQETFAETSHTHDAIADVAGRVAGVQRFHAEQQVPDHFVHSVPVSSMQ